MSVCIDCSMLDLVNIGNIYAVGIGVLTIIVTDSDVNTNSDVTVSIDTSITSGARSALFFDVRAHSAREKQWL